MDWTTNYDDPEELRAAFAGSPDARYRPLPAWWWSGEKLEQERLRWQLERIEELGCGGAAITGLALHGPAGGSTADDPPGFSDEWLRLYRWAMEWLRDHDMGGIALSPFGPTLPIDTARALSGRPDFRGELVHTRDGVRVDPFGFDWGSRDAVDEIVAPGSLNHRMSESLDDLYGDAIVAVFEDEMFAFPRWSPTFAREFRDLKGYEFPVEAFDQDIGPRTPAVRWDLFDVATTRVEGAYTSLMREDVNRHGLLAGFDQNGRQATPAHYSLYYLDPFRTLRWANAPGMDQMGDCRFHLSMCELHGGARVWLEGFHSHGWGMTLEHQLRLLYEWGREGANLFLPHGMYYAGRGFWWEWAPPEIGWKSPYARHYPQFAEECGRLMMALAAGRHVPEVAVLYPLSTVWADTVGHLEWGEHAQRAEAVYLELFGMHGAPSGRDPERPLRPSLLAERFYDRVVVDEANVDRYDIPVIVPGCLCLQTETVHRLLKVAAEGQQVIVVEPVPAWSAEAGRDDPDFRDLVDQLCEVATVVTSATAAVNQIPPPRIDGLKAQRRRVGDLDMAFLTGSGPVRLRGMADRRSELWDLRTGRIRPMPATTDGDDLLLDLDGPATLVGLPAGRLAERGHAPDPIPAERTYDTVDLPQVWDCEFLDWGENRWGDYVLPPNEGTPPVQRRTFAFREGDDASWSSAPVVPEDIQHPTIDLGFQDRMAQVVSRPRPEDRSLPDGWHEAVSTFGVKGRLGGGRTVSYSERYGLEDVHLDTPIGLKGWVPPWKVDLGSDGAGRIVTFVHVPEPTDTHLVIEGGGILTVRLDDRHLLGPVDGGVVSIPVKLEAGWHEVTIDVLPRLPAWTGYHGFRQPPRTKLAWVLSEPYERTAISIWGGSMIHPDYKGAQHAQHLRRRIVVSEEAAVRTSVHSTGAYTLDLPDVLAPGEHLIEAHVQGSLRSGGFACRIDLEMASGTATILTDDRWEARVPGETQWGAAKPVGMMGALSVGDRDLALSTPTRRSPLTDVEWLEGPEATAGQVPQRWADAPDAPPPAWFCFTAPPGARSISVPVDGDVRAWVDGDPAEVTDGRLPLVEHARVALRVEAPAGQRGAACFRDHPVLTLGPGTMPIGRSWHRVGLDVFSGVILHRADVEMEDATDAVLDLEEVAGSVAVRVNGEDVGTLVAAPWTLPVSLRPGTNRIELEVANTLGPMVSRGIPTPFGPEDQRFSGVLGRPRLRVPRGD